MSKLISGKEALIALANDEAVEWRHPERDWFIAPKCNMRTQDFFSGVYQFRLKPQTIKINGIEVTPPKHIGFESDFGLLIHFENHEQRQKFKEALRSIFNG